MSHQPFATAILRPPSLHSLLAHPPQAGRDAGPYAARPGHWAGAFVSCARIRAVQAENARLRRLAYTDDLTGVFNRRYFMALLRTRLRQRERDSGLAMCLIDIDHFKDINDGHGHFAGDDVLRDVSRVAGDVLRRAGDALCRLGGDEFAAVYSAVSPEAAQLRAEAVRLAIRALSSRSRKAGVTVTLGLVWLDRGCDLPADELYAEADRALYRAKREGRDRVGMNVLRA